MRNGKSEAAGIHNPGGIAMGDHRVQNVKGKAKETTGKVTGNEKLVQKGRDDQDKAKVKEKAGDVKNAITGDK
jgi:uncharacterized protein YjbJ (UPF0337 family)